MYIYYIYVCYMFQHVLNKLCSSIFFAGDMFDEQFIEPMLNCLLFDPLLNPLQILVLLVLLTLWNQRLDLSQDDSIDQSWI